MSGESVCRTPHRDIFGQWKQGQPLKSDERVGVVPSLVSLCIKYFMSSESCFCITNPLAISCSSISRISLEENPAA